MYFNSTYVGSFHLLLNLFFNFLPMRLTGKLNSLCLSITLCNWMTDFLTNRPQIVQIGSQTSSMSVLNTGAPQGCVLSPLLLTLYTHDSAPKHPENSVVKYADDITITGCIVNDEFILGENQQSCRVVHSENNLLLNVSKTKEQIVDFRKKEAKTHTPVYIHGAEGGAVLGLWNST